MALDVVLVAAVGCKGRTDEKAATGAPATGSAAAAHGHDRHGRDRHGCDRHGDRHGRGQRPQPRHLRGSGICPVLPSRVKVLDVHHD